MMSPYFAAESVDERLDVTRNLLRAFPLDDVSLADVVLDSWGSIFSSRIGRAHIGPDIRPQPQVMGFLLHELIPLELGARFDGWRRGDASEKDAVWEPEPEMSFEIKTSSDRSSIFGNRSFGVDNPSPRASKAKSGYYLTVNFEKWMPRVARPAVTVIRFGWIDSTDWRAQAAETGQNSTLPALVYRTQLPVIYSHVY